MSESVSAVKSELEAMLNSSAFTTDSIEGWIIIIVLLILIRGFWMKATKAIGWSIGCLFFFQICYGLSLTGFNDLIPLSMVFKFDIMTSVAQCFVGTKLCDILLWWDSYIIIICSRLWDGIGSFVLQMLDIFKSSFKDFNSELGLDSSSLS